MSGTSRNAYRWNQVYDQTPLARAPFHFANMANSQFMMQYLAAILQRCPQGGRTLETGIGSGHGAIWLSLRGIHAEGLDYSPGIIERARQVNNLLGGSAQFRYGDLFDLYATDKIAQYDVIHHQGVLEHLTVPQIHAALAQQIVRATWVVFSVPSVYYPFEPEFGDERLMPIEEWERVLEPFKIEELRYYGDPQHGEREHILSVLRGEPMSDRLRAIMTVGEKPYLPGISAIVHTRNEERNIGDCMKCVADWTDQLIVCDMESSDATVEIAQSLGAEIVAHPLIANFDGARNVSAMRARHEWVLYIDADERVPVELGRRLRELVDTSGDEFEAVYLPMRHYFSGHWMQCLYPGYTAPRLLKNGKFHFNRRLHSGAVVDGRTIRYPADDPNLAVAHYSYDDFTQYLDKLNRYTSGEAGNMHRDGQAFHWQDAVRHFVADAKMYYDHGHAHRDGVHGFLWSFMSAFYRFEQHAKLFELRDRAGVLQATERTVPQSMEQMLEYALAVCREQPTPVAPPIRIAPIPAPPFEKPDYKLTDNLSEVAEPADNGRVAVASSESARADYLPFLAVRHGAQRPTPAGVVWSGPVYSPSGYGEESRNLLLGAASAGLAIACQALPWEREAASMPDSDNKSLAELAQAEARPGFVHIVHDFPSNFFRHPKAGVCIGRTVFETDRLPAPWVQACNRMDYIWVATEFNRETFARAGVRPEKLVVIPESLDVARYRGKCDTRAIKGDLGIDGCYTFLSVFDWTLHKGWDILLKAFLQEFADEDSVFLILKVWSSNGYPNDVIRVQASRFVQESLGIDLNSDKRIRFLFDRLGFDHMIALYKAADCYVMPSRGEGWGRPYMEAMACGKPTIGTAWSGNASFMNAENSYLLDYDLVPVPENAWREVPTYRGHRWAQPKIDHLRRAMREVVEHPAEAAVIGARAAADIAAIYSREAVGALIKVEIERINFLISYPEQLNKEAREGGISFAKGADLPARAGRSLARVRWEGAQFQLHSLGHVNREMCLGLLDAGVEMSIVSTEGDAFGPDFDPRLTAVAERQFATLSGPADVHVRHFFPPRWEMPDEGHFVLMQPWEYGFIPSLWVDAIAERVTEVWCNSTYVRDTYLASGVPAEKLHIMPLGIDPNVFNLQAPPYIFTDERGAAKAASSGDEPFIFLYLGGTLHRKGIDILLDAFEMAFSSLDNVCLVVKDMCTNGVYNGQNEQERILRMVDDKRCAPIIYFDSDLTPHQLAGVYTAADCLVAPYRGEGFCLPVLEAMACGLPVIVPEGGSTDDFVDEAVGWRLPAEHKPFGNGRIGQWDCAGPTWMFEVAPGDLARQMRRVAADRAEARKRGTTGAQRAAAGWTWRHSTDAVLARLSELQALNPAKAALRSSEARNQPLTRRASRSKRRPQNAYPSVRPAPKISLCMIVRDEERVLDACLTSAKPWFDEIVLVDTGSKDRTVEIAKSHGCRIRHFEWCDDFSAARNISLKHATGDWVMWMDADDTLPEECGRKLHDLAFLAEERTFGFMLQVHIPPAPSENGFTIVDHVKLFRNRPDLRFEGRIHEQILEAIYRAGGKIERTNLHVVHSGYDYSPEGQEKKHERDLRHLEKDLADRPDHPFVLFNIGMTAYHLKDYSKAQAALERCLVLSKPNESTVRKVYAMLAGCHLERSDVSNARTVLERGLALYPRDPELLFRAGIIYREAGDLAAAEQAYLRLFNDREAGHIDSLDVTMTGFKAHHNLALIYQDMGRLELAARHFKAAVDLAPDFEPSKAGLAAITQRLLTSK